MQMMYAFGIGLVLFLAVFLFIRKDVQGGTLNERGFYDRLFSCYVYSDYRNDRFNKSVTIEYKNGTLHQ